MIRTRSGEFYCERGALPYYSVKNAEKYSMKGAKKENNDLFGMVNK